MKKNCKKKSLIFFLDEEIESVHMQDSLTVDYSLMHLRFLFLFSFDEKNRDFLLR
jgi:hypothetical protein